MKHLPVLNIQQFASDTDKDLFYSNNFARHLRDNHHSITVPHKHDFYLTVLFTQGEGIHEIDFTTYQVHPGSLFFLKPGQTHHWVLSEDIDGYIFFHSGAFYDLTYSTNRLHHFPFFRPGQHPAAISLSAEMKATAISIFQAIEIEYGQEAAHRHRKLCSLIDQLYIDLSRVYKENNEGQVIKSVSYLKKVDHLQELIDQHFLKEKSPTFYASLMNTSSKHLNRMVQEVLNKTTGDLIAERVFLEAKRMLVRAEVSFTEIADFLHFEDYPYFSRAFKKRCGETPSEFRRKYLMNAD